MGNLLNNDTRYSNKLLCITAIIKDDKNIALWYRTCIAISAMQIAPVIPKRC